jgi:hypothetical protein
MKLASAIRPQIATATPNEATSSERVTQDEIDALNSVAQARKRPAMWRMF